MLNSCLPARLRSTREGISHTCFLYYILLRYSGCSRFARQLNEHIVYLLAFKELYEIQFSFLFGRVNIVWGSRIVFPYIITDGETSPATTMQDIRRCLIMSPRMHPQLSNSQRHLEVPRVHV